MRLHLIIQRHGLPVTRILWTTASPSLYGQNTSSALPAFASAITSSRAPNALYANGGYTIAQLLEDVNEVVPLETEPALFDSEFSGQWGLEDYVVEVGGSECLHFMEVEGLLRDGDEILIRALQISDLRARRLTGRHQISTDGKHLIDGVPFGKPFLKRPVSSRPAITIPPRKRRRTTFATQDNVVGYHEEDTEWALPRIRSLKELSALRGVDEPETGIMDGNVEYNDDEDEDEYEDYHENREDAGNGTVIRHHIDNTEDAEASESGADASDIDTRDLEDELKDLKEDLDISAMPETEPMDDEQHETEHKGYALRSRLSTSHAAPTRGSVAQDIQASPEGRSFRRDSKSVRFSQQKKESPLLPSQESLIAKAPSVSESSSNSSDSASSTSVSDSSDTDSGVGSSSSDDSSESSDDSSSDSSISTSESEDEEISTAPLVANPPGHGSVRTKKSNQRNKMRRRLSKLKELGALPAEADFAALRDWEDKNKGQRFVPESSGSNNGPEMDEFEERRQKLLRDIDSGGIDITDGTFSPLKPAEESNQSQPKELAKKHDAAMEEAGEVGPEPKRRTLDVASSRRLLFGSLGVRTPRTKEDEEATRKKLAGKANNFVSQKNLSDEPTGAPESDLDEDWENKLVIRATECIYDDIQLTAPPFPFEQRWDYEAGDLIRQRKGLGKKRKRRQQLQVYDGEENYYGGGENSFVDGDLQPNYDDSELHTEANNHEAAQTAEENSSDLPSVPSDPSSLRDLVEDDLKCGCVLAFKQLEVSKATNWQPTVTDFRVAMIHDVYDDKTLNLRLAKRDRRQIKETEVEEDGPQYSGFEMPGYEDEGEDDGFREMSFADLIDPKLLRPAELEKTRQTNNSPELFPRNPSPATIQPGTSGGLADYEQTIKESGKRINKLAHEVSTSSTTDGMHASAGDASPEIRSPTFDGFQSSSPTSGQPLKDSLVHEASSATDRKANDSDSSHSDPHSLLGKDVQSMSHSSPPPILPDNFSSPPSDDDLQMLSTPGSGVSFSRLMDQLFDGDEETSNSPPVKREVSQLPERPESRSSPDSVVPNPFYKIDKARETQRRRSSQKQISSTKEGDSTMDYVSAVEFPSSSPRRSARVRKRKSYPSQDDLLVSAPMGGVPRGKQKIPGAQDSSASHEIIDLTQASPARSAGGNDQDFTRTRRLSRDPGWVHKNIPSTRRQTRLSSAGPKVDVMKEVSISPSPRRGEKRRPKS
ncbi:hypothetical protein BDV38DRAFT_256910 [Aspergillus pseudotamarii]|uniref:Uncharacterized protein n=1 Tax=Aspergillus pseudotamarii TaxID=132259 RepID=A0A5N6SH35_ASPPS|nr:uncharacterized protein BDV38DRAFT_256910 [Aspergillus pseudotamarii]KAE8133982.1 hypothetical protein BDV38DRAFT_256910 [Aspergillus pseudotamarii]